MVPSTVLTYGTFDLFHIGHVNLLKRLSELGDRLIVGCSTDEFNSLKGKRSVLPFEQRVQVLRSCRYVDDVFAEECWEQKRADIIRLHVNVFGMGDDWAGRFDSLSDIVKVVYIPRTREISTTEIRQFIHAMHEEHVSELRSATERLNQIVARF